SSDRRRQSSANSRNSLGGNMSPLSCLLFSVVVDLVFSVVVDLARHQVFGAASIMQPFIQHRRYERCRKDTAAAEAAGCCSLMQVRKRLRGRTQSPLNSL